MTPTVCQRQHLVKVFVAIPNEPIPYVTGVSEAFFFFFNKHQIPVYFKLKQSPTKKNSNSPQRRNAIPKTFSISGSSFSLVLIFRFSFQVKVWCKLTSNLNMFHIYGWTEGQGNKWSHTGGRLPWDIHTDKHIKANAAPELSALISWYPWQQHIHSCIRSHPLSQVSLSLPLSHTQAHILFRSSMYSCRTEGECESKSRKMRTVKHVCKRLTMQK